MSILYNDLKIASEETPFCNLKLSLNQTGSKYNPGREGINIRYSNLLHPNFDELRSQKSMDEVITGSNFLHLYFCFKTIFKLCSIWNGTLHENATVM